MEKIYQIVAKGIATNRIYLYEFEKYKEFRETLKLLVDCEKFIVITTNQTQYAK